MQLLLTRLIIEENGAMLESNELVDILLEGRDDLAVGPDFEARLGKLDHVVNLGKLSLHHHLEVEVLRRHLHHLRHDLGNHPVVVVESSRHLRALGRGLAPAGDELRATLHAGLLSFTQLRPTAARR